MEVLPFVSALTIYEQTENIVNAIKISMTTLEDTSISKSQEPVEYPVQTGFPMGRGAKQSNPVVTITGAVCDDPLWAPLTPLAGSKASIFPSPRKRTSADLEYLFDNQILVTVEDTVIGTRTDLLITGLAMYPSQEYENTTVYSITLVQQRFAILAQNNAVAGHRTIDPYQFYDFDDTQR